MEAVGDQVWAVVVAAGTGSRFGDAKQYAPLAGRRVLDWSLAGARAVADGVVVVVPPGRASRAEPDADVTVPGGASRSASVRAGLAAVPEDAGIVIVHDGARPLASTALFREVVEAVAAGADAAVPGIPVTDTLRRRSGDTLERSDLLAVQTPQAFRAAALRAAHAGDPDATDDASLVERAGGKVAVVDGSPTNLKVTHPLDIVVAEALLAATGEAP